MEIEHSEKCHILLAVESGRRAWGFPSPDSDYDVRFIYVRPMEHYLKLEQTRDVIELPINDLLDMNGWDLKKALCLLHRSNPTYIRVVLFTYHLQANRLCKEVKEKLYMSF